MKKYKKSQKRKKMFEKILEKNLKTQKTQKMQIEFGLCYSTCTDLYDHV